MEESYQAGLSGVLIYSVINTVLDFLIMGAYIYMALLLRKRYKFAKETFLILFSNGFWFLFLAVCLSFFLYIVTPVIVVLLPQLDFEYMDHYAFFYCDVPYYLAIAVALSYFIRGAKKNGGIS